MRSIHEADDDTTCNWRRTVVGSLAKSATIRPEGILLDTASAEVSTFGGMGVVSGSASRVLGGRGTCLGLVGPSGTIPSG